MRKNIPQDEYFWTNKGRHQSLPPRATNREMLVSCLCDFCGMSPLRPDHPVLHLQRLKMPDRTDWSRKKGTAKGKTSKYTAESHKLLQGAVSVISAACHKNPVLLSVSGVGLLYGAI